MLYCFFIGFIGIFIHKNKLFKLLICYSLGAMGLNLFFILAGNIHFDINILLFSSVVWGLEAAETAVVLFLFIVVANCLAIINIKMKNIFTMTQTYNLVPVVLNELFFYPTPNNFNYFYCVGFLLGLLLSFQFVTGILVACYYIPKVGIAFTSVDYLIRDIVVGWFISFLHSNGASFFLSFIYIHIIRSICYSSFQTPKHKIWLSGLMLFLILSLTAFIGYVLPWGQMSFWGATVIINFLTVVPYIGSALARLLWGGFNVNKATLNRFFVLHFIIPVFVSFISVLHIILIHQFGGSNPLHTGNIKETITFHPYFKIKDMLGMILVCSCLSELICYSFHLGHSVNYILANPLITPEHIVPEWYFLALYGILRAIPNKLFGIISMFSLIIHFIQAFILHE